MLEINNNMFVSRLMNHTLTYKGQTETNNKSLINKYTLFNKQERNVTSNTKVNK